MTTLVESVEDTVKNTLVINGSTQYETKAYKRRWYILSLFIWYSGVNSYQWIEYSSITNIIVKYYNVSTLAVDWTSIIYMALYPIFVIPASYIIDKKGLRAAGLIGCIGTAIGTSVKLFSINRDLFWVVILGQAIVSASQILILCLPPKIAAIWFKPSEISTACAFGVFGTQLGTAIGFILSPAIVHNHDNPEDIGTDLKTLGWLLAGSMVPVTVAVILYFPNHPPKPPSVTQAKERYEKPDFKTKAFFSAIKSLFHNKGFVIHMIGYSINIGVFSAVGTLLAQFILYYFEGAQEDAGGMGFVMVLVGMIGSIAFGVILDKTRKFKETTFIVYLMSSVSVVALMFALKYQSKIFSYISCGIVGLFTSAYWSVGFELAMELTYPSEESTTVGILVAMTQILGVLFACGLGYLNLYVGPFWSLGSQAALLLVGTIVTGLIPNNLRRQAAFAEYDNQKFASVPQSEKYV